MAEAMLDILEKWGIWGILASLFIEGSAFPFIGTFFIVTVGFLMDLTWFEIAWISMLGSLSYAVGSYIPYSIGYFLEGRLKKRLSSATQERLVQAQTAFSKHGIWSVAISSPLHLGNVVPFVAGMARMDLRIYTLLTLLGIAPTTFLLLSIGRLYPGDTETVIHMIDQYQGIVLVVFIAVTAIYMAWKIISKRRKQSEDIEINN
jgi:membrane protein DedA with SNARE-associated domain